MKYRLLLTLFLLAVISWVYNPTFCVCANSNEIDTHKTLQHLVRTKQYSQAYELLRSSCIDNCWYVFDQPLYNTILDHQKQYLTITTTALLKNNQPEEALSLLKQHETFFQHSTEFQQLYATANYQNNKNNWCLYQGKIPILSFNPLLAHPDTALHPNNPKRLQLANNHLTPTEFSRVLNNLYDNNYVLVDIFDKYNVINHEVQEKELYIPNNKKPIIIHLNNHCYPKDEKGKGLVDKIIVDDKNKLATYTSKKSIQDRISYNNETITILENFIAKHPDFVHNGARPIISFSGEEGILGYKTQKTNANSRYDIKKALQVVTKLNNLGYRFASNGYAYTPANMNDMYYNKDCYSWREEVGNIVGDTPLYISTHPLQPNYTTVLQNYDFPLLITPDNNKHLPIYEVTGKNLQRKDLYLTDFFNPNDIISYEERDVYSQDTVDTYIP